MVLHPQTSLQQPHPLTICSHFGVTVVRTFAVYCWNARSIFNKLSELHHLLYNYCSLSACILTYVSPLLEYNIIVWSPYHQCDIVAIENVQRRFTKRLPGFAEHSYSNRLLLLICRV